MFSVAESDVWDSSSVQDVFIKEYFKKQTAPTVNKSSKKNDNEMISYSNNYFDKNVEYQNTKDIFFHENNKKNPIKCKKKKKLLDYSIQSDNLVNCPRNKNSEKESLNKCVSQSDISRSKKKKRKLEMRENSEDKSDNFFDESNKSSHVHCKKKKKSLANSLQNNSSANSQKNKKSENRNLTEPVFHCDKLTNKKKKQKLKKKEKHLLQTQVHSNSDSNINQYNSDSKPLDINIDINKVLSHDEIEINLNKPNNFQSKFRKKLQAAKFRYLNEMLYTNTGKDALEYFQKNVEEFQDYHIGYQLQVSKWPVSPVDIIIKELHFMKKVSVIADLGCGEAKIAEKFPHKTVHSFDLMAIKDSIIACDIAHVPLPKESVDVTVFCLSLMGTNWKDYLREGHRILKLGGVLKIAELESRIDNLNAFIKNIECYGFSHENENTSHKMFVFLDFKKVKKSIKTSKIQEVILKPCLYKKR